MVLMKIGIMTFHAALNCGAVLQAYALQTVLERLGNKVEFINYTPHRYKTLRQFLGRGVNVTFRKWQDLYFACRYQKKFSLILKVAARRYQTFRELQKAPPQYDLYLAGSDQIWNPGSQNRILPAYYLDFETSGRKIAYAASFGQGDIIPELYPTIRALLKSFSAITVREQNGVEKLRSILGDSLAVEQMCDPTFLLQCDDYRKICGKKDSGVASESYICTYVLRPLDQVQLEQIGQLSQRLGMTLIHLKNPDTGIRFPSGKHRIVTPETWLAYMLDAGAIFCHSFHAVVFSLLFHKPFLAFIPEELERSGGNQRLNSLLVPMGLEKRCVSSSLNISELSKILVTPIDWEAVDRQIEQMRQTGWGFLTTWCSGEL